MLIRFTAMLSDDIRFHYRTCNDTNPNSLWLCVSVRSEVCSKFIRDNQTRWCVLCSWQGQSAACELLGPWVDLQLQEQRVDQHCVRKRRSRPPHSAFASQSVLDSRQSAKLPKYPEECLCVFESVNHQKTLERCTESVTCIVHNRCHALLKLFVS